MTVTSIQKDTDASTMEVTAEFDADRDRVWQLWSDPRRLERWWGPPTYPATFVDHDLSPGGTVTYFMTGPEGDRHGGLWRVVEVEPGQRLVFEDAFADADGNVNADLPTTTTEVTFSDRAGGGTTMGTRMTVLATFPSPEAMQQLLEMGMEEGLAAAMGQMDALLA
jgi:uncharacterized protein YndB with AHSA1/START domain